MTPPADHPEHDARASRVVFMRLVAWVTAAAVVAIITANTAMGTLRLREVAVVMLYLAVAVATLFLLRQRKPHLAALILVWGILACLACSTLLIGGLTAPAVPLFIVVIGISGWLLGPRSLLAVALTVMALIIVVYLLQSSGLMAVREFPLWRRLIVLLGIVTVTVALASYVLRSQSNASAALKASEERFRAMTLLSADWFWEIDDQLRFTRVAGKGLEKFGLSPATMIGRRTADFTGFAPLGESGDRYRQARSEHKPYREILMGTRLADGSNRYVSISGEPVFGKDGKFAGYRGVTRDVTDQYLARAAEKRLYSALDDFDETFILCDSEDRIVMTNKRFRERNAPLMDRLTEASTYEDYLRLALPLGFFPDAAGREEAWIAERLAQRRNPDAPLEAQRRDGVWLLVQDHRLPDGSTITMGRNITERKRTEDLLVQNEARFRAIFESSKAGIATWGLDGRFLTANEAFCEFVGYSAEALVGRMSAGNLRQPGEDEGLDLTGRMLLGEIPHITRDRQYRRSDASTVWGRTTVAGVRGKDGRLQYFVAVVIDITEAREARTRIERINLELDQRVRERTSELNNAIERLEEANRELDSFNFSIAHDLRQPLSAIGGFADLLQDPAVKDSPGDLSAFAAEVELNAHRMEQMIEALLRFSNVGRGELKRSRVDMKQAAQAALDNLASVARLRAEVTIGDLPEAQGDEALLRHVWSNLIGNALKYSGKAEAPKVEIRGERRDGRLEYTVRDNGVGFDMRHLGDLFGVFQRLPTSAGFEGTGVGLAIVQRIVRRHGGQVTAESVPGQGATFRFTLPG